jgi:hypothetical protein
MKYTILLSLLTILLCSCEKDISPAQAERFVKFYGSNLMDEAGEVKALSTGGYAICGTINSPGTGKRMALILTDKNGNMLSDFPRFYTDNDLETGCVSMLVLEGGSGGFLLSGYVERPVEGTENVQKDVFLVRTNSSGVESWKRSYGSGDDEQVLHSIKRIGSGFLLAGYKERNGRSDVLVMGVTESGDSIRLGFNYNNPYSENARASYLLNTGQDYLCVCTLDKPNEDGTDLYVLSFDNELSPLEKRITAGLDVSGTCIVEVSTNQYMILGNRVNNSGSMEMVLYSIEKNGLFIINTEELATISEANADLIGNRMIKTRDGRYALVGTRMEGGDGHIILQFISSSVTVGEQRSYGATGVQAGRDVDEDPDRGIVLLGENNMGANSIISLIKTSETGDL